MHDTNTVSFVKLNAVLATPPNVSGWTIRDAGAPAQTHKGAQEEGWPDLGSSGTWWVQSPVEFAKANGTRDSGLPKLKLSWPEILAICK